ncbi:Dolichyl-diphosphooligosaccharide--protein glycosyltransferase subunit stt3b, partial [Goodea atripinnis]
MAEHHQVSDSKHKSSLTSAAPYSGNGGSSTAVAERDSMAGAGGGLSGGLSQPAGWQSLLSFTVLFLACLAGFSSRLFAVIRFESIIHEFDPW